MTTSSLTAAIAFPTLPAGYVWSVTDYLGFPDGDPKDPAYRLGQRVLIAVHRTYRFAFLRFSIRVGRVKAYVVDPRENIESIQQSVDEIFESLQRRLASDSTSV